MSTRIITAPADELPLEDASVDLICTSPPYYMLREYRDGGERVEGQIGLEDTWEGYIHSLVRCTREWMRVLKPTGSIWVNLGDKYGRGMRTTIHGGHSKQAYVDGDRPGVCAPTGYEKSLIGLPWRYAFRCTDELGLKLRAEVIWAKVNGTPESVLDRVRRSHEHFFHFTKQEKYYYATNDIRIPYTDENFAANGQRAARSGTVYSNERLSTNYDMGEDITANPLGRLPGSVWEVASEPLQIPAYLRGANGGELNHYAAFPTALIRPVIKGWSPKNICAACGEGRFPVPVAGAYGYVIGYACKCTPYTDHPERRGNGWHEHADDLGQGQTQHHSKRDLGGAIPLDGGQVRANGVRPSQGPVREYHLDSWTPPPSTKGIVLDPFGGAGTTALVATVLDRDGISSDLSKDYAKIAEWRVMDGAERARALGEKKTPKARRVHEHLYGDLFAELDELMG